MDFHKKVVFLLIVGALHSAEEKCAVRRPAQCTI